MSTDKYLQAVRQIVLDEVDLASTAVFLFGGRAKGSTHRGSDVDIGLLSEERISRDLLTSIKVALEESIVPYRCDVVDFFNVDPVFKKVALEKIEIWNCPKHINIV